MENNFNQEQLLLPEPSIGRKLFKQFLVIGIVLLVALVGGFLIYQKSKPQKIIEPAPIVAPINTSTMIIASEAFQNNGIIPAKYTCDGLNINPALRFAEIPAGTVSLALIVSDPDAPAGDWSNWVVWNIPADTKIIQENSAPSKSEQGMTDFGANKYGGPCPPEGTHHYEFKLYALNSMLALPKATSKAELMNAMQNHIIAEATLTGVYSR